MTDEEQRGNAMVKNLKLHLEDQSKSMMRNHAFSTVSVLVDRIELNSACPSFIAVFPQSKRKSPRVKEKMREERAMKPKTDLKPTKEKNPS